MVLAQVVLEILRKTVSGAIMRGLDNSNNKKEVSRKVSSDNKKDVKLNARQGCFQHAEKFRARDAVDCFNVFLSAGNNPGVLKNSTEHAEALFIALRQFPQVNSIQLMTMY